MHLTAPFIIVQMLDYDFVSDDADIFKQAASQPEDRAVRHQHMHTGKWLQDIFADQELREAAGLTPEHHDFFTCGEGKDLSLSFKFLRMDEKATHAVFLMQGVPRNELRFRGALSKDPDMPGYPGQISLGKNRAVWYKKGNYRRLWEMYSSHLLTLREPVVKGKEPKRK